MRPALILGLALVACSLAAPPGWAKDPAPAKPAGKPAPGAAQTPAPQAPGASTPGAKTTDGQAGAGETIDDAKQYQHCIALARQKPQDGWEEALAWSSLGGGEPARHCEAIALVGLKDYEKAANLLEDLAKTSHKEARLRAGMLAQAGQAWLLAKNPERAYAAQTAALKLVPDAPDLLVDRAESLGEAKNYKDALADLDRALKIAPNRADALTYRATAKRFLDDQAGAATDIDAALKVDPQYQDAWLERGILRRLAGDDAQARQAWMKVLEIAPHSAAADSARENIQLLDVKAR